MDPFVLRTERLVLDQPLESDVDRIAAYCADPLFERFMVTPWPYERRHAESFVEEFAPSGWATGSEWTWAVREAAGGPILGVVGIRMATGMVGYWLGSPHRGRGVVPEALGALITTVFERTARPDVLWECVVGNRASARVAEKTGFRFLGRGPGIITSRDGTSADAWTARLARGEDRGPKDGWPL